MDRKNRRILEILKEDGRASFTDIADELNVSEGTVRRRVQDMKEDGVIDRFTVELGSTAAKAIVMVKLSTNSGIDQVLKEFPEDMAINEVAGEYDLIVEFERANNERINQVLDKVREIEGVEETKTYTVLKQRRL
ncbi:MAG: DNA-binding Lrp family transcriptional regulator [Candidatus Nanohaloarchaea archaeon]|jgi:DNA-binding Lrp family transcriptional regulator